MAQQEVIEKALTNYLGAIKSLGVVDEVIVGTIPGQPQLKFLMSLRLIFPENK